MLEDKRFRAMVENSFDVVVLVDGEHEYHTQLLQLFGCLEGIMMSLLVGQV